MVLLNSSSCNFDWQPDNFQFINLKGEKGSFYESFDINGLFDLNSLDKKEIFSSSVHSSKLPKPKCLQMLFISFECLLDSWRISRRAKFKPKE